MKTYIGTKIVNAQPQDKFNETGIDPETGLMGLDVIPGYKVVYEDGYTRWSPKDIFDRSYREVTDAEKNLFK